MTIAKRISTGAVGLLLALIATSLWAADKEPEHYCLVATYRLANGEQVDVSAAGESLRWRTLDGRVGTLRNDADDQWSSSLGWTSTPDGTQVSFGPCGSGAIRFNGHDGRAVLLEVKDAVFDSGGTSLSGRLVLPEGDARVPVMVLGHGSERWSALDNAFRQRLYPAAGIGVFVFDKRGTGSSEGTYTQDFDLLADDMVAAMVAARETAGDRGERFGFQGGSQAGWILPLASTRTPADFVIVGYGIAASPVVEDRTETLQALTAAGWGPDVLAKAREVTDATATIILSRFTDGYDELRKVVAKYGVEPWFKDLDGEFTGEIVRHTEEQIRVVGPQRDTGTLWGFDAVGNLARVQTPLLWVIAGSDTEGPGEETPANLKRLKAAGRPFTIALFPGVEHGIHQFRVNADGHREKTGYAPDYFKMEIDFARDGKLTGKYKSAIFLGE